MIRDLFFAILVATSFHFKSRVSFDALATLETSLPKKSEIGSLFESLILSPRPSSHRVDN
jgi:hypothetical protein